MNVVQHAVQRVAASSPGAAFFRVTRIDAQDRLVHRLTGSRTTVTGVFAGFPTVFVTTVGCRTGAPHTVPLVGLTDPQRPGRLGLIASNYGQGHDPDWCRNLRRNPEALVAADGTSTRYLAAEVSGDDYERWFTLGYEAYSGFRDYRRRVDRTIPVFELTPA